MIRLTTMPRANPISAPTPIGASLTFFSDIAPRSISRHQGGGRAFGAGRDGDLQSPQMTQSATEIELDGQYRALREEAGFLPRERGVLLISGPDAVDYLQS